jgi:nucleoside-diphosphate-sugar epimerase
MTSLAKSKCLVIGGAGNLGGHIITLLLERGAASVSCFDVVPYRGDGKHVESFTGDICDSATLADAMRGVEMVFHTASIIDLRPVPSYRMQRVNVDGTFNVIQACKRAGVGVLVYTSSLEVVSGVCEDGVTVQPLNGVDETVPIPPHHHLEYAATKAAAERLVMTAHSQSLRTVCIRPGFIQGPGSIGLKLEMLKAKLRSNRYVTAKVPAKISTVHPRNAALAHLLAAEKVNQDDVGGQAFFVRDFEAGVVDMTLEALKPTPIIPVLLPLRMAYYLAWVIDICVRFQHLLYALVGARPPKTSEDVLSIRAVNMAYIDIIVSDARARKVLGYKPLVSKEDCLREASAWCVDFYRNLPKGEP